MSTPKNGFTLIEITVVLAVVGLLMVIVFLSVAHAQRATRDAARVDAVNHLVADVVSDNKSTGFWDQCTVAPCTAPTGWVSPGNPTLTFDPSAPTLTKIQWVSSLPPPVCGINGNLDGYAQIKLEAGGTYCQNY